MKRRVLISVLVAWTVFFTCWMNAIEDTIKTQLPVTAAFQSFACNLELPNVTKQQINATIGVLHQHQLTPMAQKLLLVDYGFMVCYLLVALWLLQMRTVLGVKIHALLKILAWLQLVSFACDAIENGILHYSLSSNLFDFPIAAYRLIEYGKWAPVLTGVSVIVLGSLYWGIRFLVSLKKSGVEMNY